MTKNQTKRDIAAAAKLLRMLDRIDNNAAIANLTRLSAQFPDPDGWEAVCAIGSATSILRRLIRSAELLTHEPS